MNRFALFAMLAMEATAFNTNTKMGRTMMEKVERHTISARTHEYTENQRILKEAVADGPAPCENGLIAGTFPCKDMDLIGFLSGEDMGSPMASNSSAIYFPTYVSDIWGWVDPMTGSEYALVSLWDGTSVIDITDPANPEVLVFVETTRGVIAGLERYRSFWRDIKVVNDVMYIGSEITFHGIQTYDLTRFRDDSSSKSKITKKGAARDLRSKKGGVKSYSPHGVPIVAPDYTTPELGATHNIIAVPAMDKMMACGMNADDITCPGTYVGTEWERLASLAVFDVSGDPTRPVFEECIYIVGGDRGYVHDAHCVVYHGPTAAYQGVNVCAFWMEEEIIIYNMDDHERINTFTYEGATYVHQGAFSEDHSILYADDELDEHDCVTSEWSSTYIFDISELDGEIAAPSVFVTPEDNTHPHIDHNMYIKDGYIYQAAYNSGARVRKIVDRTTIEEVAWMDPQVGGCECAGADCGCDCDMWLGTWTFWPFYDSGITIAGSSSEGLLILQPNL